MSHRRPARAARVRASGLLFGASLSQLASAADLAPLGEVGGAVRVGVLACEGRVADCPLVDLQDLAWARGRLSGEVAPGANLALDATLRLHTRSAVTQADDASEGNRVQPFSLDVNEAWVEAADWPAKGVDLRLGQQRLAWGSAEGIHPVDRVNPYDLRDPFRFDQRLGTMMLNTRLRRGDGLIELVWAPLFRPARLPSELRVLDQAADLFDFSDVGGGDARLGELSTLDSVPDTRLGYQSFAARASLAHRLADVALVGWMGRDSLPQVGGQARLLGFGSANRIDVGLPVVYPALAMVGAELRAPLFWDLAFWAEGGAFFPERTAVTANRAQLEALVRLEVLDEVPDPLPEAVVQDGLPYGQWVTGIERNFGRTLINLQWIHGLPTERSRADLRDYAALGLRSTPGDRVEVVLRGVTDLEGVLAGATVSYLHADSVTLGLGADVAIGARGSAIDALRPLSNVALTSKVAF